MRNLLVMACVWSVTGVCFYINNSFLKRIPGDFQLNTLVANCADIVAIPLATWLFMKGSSIKALLFTYSIFVALAGLCMIMFLEQDEPSMAGLAYVAVNRGGIVASFTNLY